MKFEAPEAPDLINRAYGEILPCNPLTSLSCLPETAQRRPAFREARR